MSTTLKRRWLLVAFAALAAMVFALALTGCSEQAAESSADAYENAESAAGGATGTIGVGEDAGLDMADLHEANIIALNGPTGIGIVKFMDDAQALTDNKFNFNLVSAPDQATAAVINGEADIAFVPTNLAATLYNKLDHDLKMIAITCLGNLYILEEGTSITTIEDLKGQTIYATGQGANPQYILEHLLTQAGLTPGEDVTVEFLSEHAELATLAASGERKIAMLPEPFVATALAKNDNLRVALNLNDLWTAHDDGKMAMGCAIVRSDYLEQYPETLDVINEQISLSIQWVNQNVDEAAALCVKYGIIADEAIAKDAIPRCALTFISGSQMEPTMQPYFEVLYDANPQSLGGSIPDPGFYYGIYENLGA